MSRNYFLRLGLLVSSFMLSYFIFAVFMHNRTNYNRTCYDSEVDQHFIPHQGIFSHYSGLYRLPHHSVHSSKDGSFVDKISDYNVLLNDVRNKVLSNFTRVERRRVTVWRLVAGNKEDYLEELSQIPNVTGVFLDWTDIPNSEEQGTWSSLLDNSNLLTKQYFPWVGSVKFCSLLQGTKFTHHRYDTVFNERCTTNYSRALEPTSIEMFVLNAFPISGKYFFPEGGNCFLPRMYTDLPKYITYVHVFENGVVTTNGEVYIENRKVVPYTCHSEFNTNRPKFQFRKLPHHGEIFSISQFWGEGFFHKTIEDFPKIAPYLSFLRDNEDIIIHVAEKDNYTESLMSLLGIEPSRLVTGNLRGDVIYLPRGTACGFARVPEVQLFSNTTRDTLVAMKSQIDERRNLVLIRRSRHRHFSQTDAIAKKLKVLCERFNLNFYVFKDDPLPSLNETMYAFNRAIMVVAPHGAGLSNLLYSEPGTYVIEGLCNPPHTNMCYTRLSYVLGHHYHALVSRGGCEGHVDIPASEIEQTARVYLEQLSDIGKD